MSEAKPATEQTHALPPREQWSEGARKLRDAYALVPGAPLVQREFGFYSLDRWRQEGLEPHADLAEVFQFDEPGLYALHNLGWCEAAFAPVFEERLIEDRGEHEVVQDFAGRHVLFFKGRRSGFMPEYLAHPVKDWETWERDVKWRLDPETPERWADVDRRLKRAREAASKGLMVSQRLIGGYMYLRSLIGPADLLYMFCEQPDLIHDCMKTWLRLADAVIARHQEAATLDEVFLAEDICFSGGPLISPDMMREFLLPYYQELLSKTRERQLDPERTLYIQIDTDGFADPVIPLYREIGMTTMSPFEVAAGCDVVRTGRAYPDMSLFGGMDKRVLAEGKAAIDAMVERVLPPMRERGGYIPTCDHGVPEEVSLENYLHYRRRCVELGS